MTEEREMLSNIREPKKPEVTVADGKTIGVKCVGDILHSMILNGEKNKVKIQNVQYMPQICANLLSVSQIVQNSDSEVVFIKFVCKIYNANREIIATGSLENNIFKLDKDLIKFGRV